MGEVVITPVALDDKPVLRHLMSLYLYDFSEFDGADVNEHGLFEDEHLDLYWLESGRYPFFVRVSGTLAGFVLVRAMEQGHSIAEFFIMRKYRRQGIGREVARQIFDSFPGWWHVAEMETNMSAQRFWRSVISEYTGGQFEDGREPGWDGPVQRFCAK
jgi:predicted acetyltransferase